MRLVRLVAIAPFVVLLTLSMIFAMEFGEEIGDALEKLKLWADTGRWPRVRQAMSDAGPSSC